MEKPAVIFSEQGWKMFLNFMSEMKQGEDTSVDNIVNAYYKREDKPEAKVNSKYDMDTVARIVFEELVRTNDEYTSQDIAKVLNRHGFVYTGQGITPVMRGIITRYPEINRVDTGLYKYIPEGAEE